MKTAIVKSSKLGTECWSTLRFTNSCSKCIRVNSCTLSESKIGRMHIIFDTIEKMQDNMKKLIAVTEEEIRKLKKEVQ